MADLGAVLRKTIDGLPNATPELRAKVYEKARAAILRQIENANPPLSDDVIAKRTAALEDAIDETEAHYFVADAVRQTPAALPEREPEAPAPPPMPPVEIYRSAPSPFPRAERSDAAPSPPAPRMPRAEPDFTATPSAEPGRERRVFSHGTDRREPAFDQAAAAPPTATEPEGGFDIPDADTSAPRYSAQRGRTSRAPLYAGIAVLALAAAGGVYFYKDQLSALLGGTTQTAGSTTEGTDTGTPAAGTETAAVPPGDTAAPTAADGGADQATETAEAPSQTARRRFTQRLMPDGTEVDQGPGSTGANAFDEGTNIAAATPEPTTPTAPAVTPAPSVTPKTEAAPQNDAAPAVAQRAMFYEERTDNQQGTQQLGNVVWSVVDEPPADDQPPEPAIRAVADIPSENIKMTMTIRRNLDQTLPASHVIELQFDVPPGFAGGQVANVQRLALKPTEEARGQPLIGVAGKISDGFFIIALNNLDKATQTNLTLLGKEQWIDVPIAYATGRRALLSVEKGVPGERVFKQVMDAWAAKT